MSKVRQVFRISDFLSAGREPRGIKVFLSDSGYEEVPVVNDRAAERQFYQLVEKRMKDGENRACAETNVVRSEEGQALWAQAYGERLEVKNVSVDPNSNCRAAQRFNELVKECMSSTGKMQGDAERIVLRTEEGNKAWEQARSEGHIPTRPE